MFLYLSKKIAIPNGVKLCSLSWNSDHGWIACGGKNGLLKVLRMETNNTASTSEIINKGPRGIAAQTNLTMNQTLEGHSDGVVCSAWNTNYRKLTTSDENGLIIVWMLHRGAWVEEMINNRNKSIVKDMKWTPDGKKICIIYEDGAVIVGSVDGNRLWGKDLTSQLSLVEWSPDSKHILFVTSESEVHLYDNAGSKITRLSLYAVDEDKNENSSYTIVAIDWYDGSEGLLDEDIPTLAIAFREGIVQIGRNELDDDPVLIDTGMDLRQCRWNTNGSVLALAGTQFVRNNSSGDKTSINVVQFYDPHGVHLKSLKVPGNKIETLSWEGGGLRICFAVDSFLYFANIRPDYKWGYFSNTLVYAFNKPEQKDSCVLFWDTKSDERYVKHIKGLFSIHGAGENCVLATKNPDDNNTYLLILCDAIGSPVDSKIIKVFPKFVTMTQYHVIASSEEEVYTWQYRTQVAKLTSISTSDNKSMLRRKDGRERMFHIDEFPVQTYDASTYQSRSMGDGNFEDPICALVASTNSLFVARSSGTMYRYTLPHISLEAKYCLDCRPQKLALNCISTRMSIIDIQNVLTFLDLDAPAKKDGFSGEILDFERKDAWDMLWADDNPELFVMMEKARMYVFRNLEPEEPVLSSGYLCQYKELQVKAALLDEILVAPEQPDKTMVLEYETRSLRDAAELLQVGLQEAYQYIEEHSHPRLWRLLADKALEQLDLSMAERGFVKCGDYQGIQYVKRLSMLNDAAKQRAEIAAYFQRFDEAESIYREMDRKDLAIELRIRLGDWFRVVQLVQSGGGDDTLLAKAWNNVGEYYADRQKWHKASQYFLQAKNTENLMKCYYKIENFEKIRQIMQTLPDGSPFLLQIAKIFQSVGLSEEAASAYLKCGDVKAAIDCCVLLNQWDKAVELAELHSFPQIEGLLTKYATHLMDQGKTLQAIELYRKANKSTEAAKLLARLAQNVKSNPLLAKKLNVLAALEVENFRKKVLDITTMTTGMTAAQTTAATLDNLMQHDAATGENRSLDNAWRGAEAYHLLLLAHRQLYQGHPQKALYTGCKLTEYEDILDMKEICSLIALSAYYTNHFEQCSNAFIKLETLETLSLQEREKYSDLALQIFNNTEPLDPMSSQNLTCPSCGKSLKIGHTTCIHCSRSFQTCMKTGITITDQRAYLCKVCRHATIMAELKDISSCPLCHSEIK